MHSDLARRRFQVHPRARACVTGGRKIRIASYNIRKAVGLDWRRDVDRIVRVLAEIDADIVVLQEADKRFGRRSGVLPMERMQQELGYAFAEVALRPDSHGWHGNAILYRPQTLELADTQRIILPKFEPRGAVSALFSTPRLEIVGVHLGLDRATRNRQLIALSDHIDATDHPTVVAGDFNIWKRDEDIVSAVGHGSRMITPGMSFHASRPVAALDRFLIPDSVGLLSSHVHRSELSARASDHLPIVMDLDIPA